LNDSASLEILAREFLIAYESYFKLGTPYEIALIGRGTG
jgi:hypothetical protein